MARHTCQQCGEVFERQNHTANPPKFCSRPCYQASRGDGMMAGSCQVCGIAFERRKRRYPKGLPKTCSKKCDGLLRLRTHPERMDRLMKAGQAARRGSINCDHGLTMYENHGCRCGTCRAARSAKDARVNNQITSAPRWGYEWTGPELEIASRDDLTAFQVAKMLGRTIPGVKTVRRKLRVDPRNINLAGI